MKFGSQSFLKIFIALNLFFLFGNQNIINAEDKNLSTYKGKDLNMQYLDSREELKDYIIDSGDVLFIEFYPAIEFSGLYQVNTEGEIILPRLDYTYVKGLNAGDIKKFLEEKYLKYLISPEITVRIANFRDVKVLVQGEVRTPGFYNFKSDTTSKQYDIKNLESNILSIDPQKFEDSQKSIENTEIRYRKKKMLNSSLGSFITISKILRAAGGPTTLSDLSKIEVIRSIPINKGGGKKRAILNLYPYINENDSSNDIRLFDGDKIIVPRLSKPDQSIISKSIFSGVSPKFITVNIFGEVKTPGEIKLPINATLSDAIDISGPIKPLSGEIIIMRYTQNGKFKKKVVKYKSKAKRGSKNNPFMQTGDLISVRDSILGKSYDFINEITKPAVGIYTTKELIEDF